MFHDLTKAAQHIPEELCYTCWQCEKDRHDREIAQSRQKATQALFIQPGSLSATVRATLQKSLIRNVVSDISTAPTYPERNSEEIDLSAIPSSPLKRNPATPTPEVREDLFQDVPNVAAPLIPMDMDRTEIRRKIILPRIATSTQEIPALNAERLLVELMRSPSHERGTGEQEPVRDKHWML